MTSAPTAPGNTISTRASFPICTASPDPKSPSQGLGHPRSPLLASLDRRLPIPNSNPRGLKVGKRPLAHSNSPSLATSSALFTSPPLQVWPCSQGASRKRRGGAERWSSPQGQHLSSISLRVLCGPLTSPNPTYGSLPLRLPPGPTPALGGLFKHALSSRSAGVSQEPLSGQVNTELDPSPSVLSSFCDLEQVLLSETPFSHLNA